MRTSEKRMKELDERVFDTVEAPPELAEKVDSVPVTSSRTKAHNGRKVYKIAAALAAAVILIAATGVAVSANITYRSKYRTVYFNGEKTEARLGTANQPDGYEDKVFQISLTRGDKIYMIEVYGDFDPKTDTLYIEERDGYVVASTEPEPRLNLYEDIDRSTYGQIINEWGRDWLRISIGSAHFGFNLEDRDTFTVAPNGCIVRASWWHTSEFPEYEEIWRNNYDPSRIPIQIDPYETPDNAD